MTGTSMCKGVSVVQEVYIQKTNSINKKLSYRNNLLVATPMENEIKTNGLL